MKRRVWLLGAGGFAALTVGVSFIFHPIRSEVDASWGGAYPSLAQMSQHSDAVVRGRITNVLGTETSTQAQDLIYTNYAFQVDKWIAGTPSGSHIVIHQMGGSSGVREMTVRDDPRFDQGAEAILFLQQYAPGKYFVLGGPTGRYPVAGGQISAMPGSAVVLPRQTVDSVVATLSSIAKAQGRAS